jgi:acyl dehydratase
MKVGQIASAKRTFSQKDLNRFAALSGDDNPIHVDPEFSARTKFGRTVAHGMLLYSAVCAVLGNQMPGPGTRQLEQELMFPNPTYTNEKVMICLEVTQVQSAEGLADLNTLVIKPDGNVGLQGRTLVQLPGARPSRPLSPEPVRSNNDQPTDSILKNLMVGQRAEIQRTFTADDLSEYADLVCDTNPIHSDALYARQAGLQGPIIPGGLLGGLFSYLLGTRLPGQGTNYLKQRLAFAAPACADEELAASVEIIRIRSEKQLVNLRTLCTNSAGEIVCHGDALVLVSDVGNENSAQTKADPIID